MLKITHGRGYVIVFNIILYGVWNTVEKLWKEHLWNPSYFVTTVSENTEEQIREYIQKQKESWDDYVGL